MVNTSYQRQKPVSNSGSVDKSAIQNRKALELKKLRKIYEETIQESLKDIQSILKEVDIDNLIIASSYNKILSASCKNLTEKWLSKRKYIRTLFAKEAFSNFYPEKYTKISLYIDALINILDDFLDEKMDQKEKTFHVIEFLRAFSLYNQEQPKKNIQTAMEHYFNKLIALAIAEDHYKNFIKKEIRIERIIKYSIESYGIRSLDIDIFNEIALINYKTPNKKIEKIKKIGRIFRIVNIIKKDIEDIKYDARNNIETIITVMTRKKEYDFNKYILDLLDYCLNEAEKIKLEKLTEKKFTIPINNFYRMIKRDQKEIKKSINLYRVD